MYARVRELCARIISRNTISIYAYRDLRDSNISTGKFCKKIFLYVHPKNALQRQETQNRAFPSVDSTKLRTHAMSCFMFFFFFFLFFSVNMDDRIGQYIMRDIRSI